MEQPEKNIESISPEEQIVNLKQSLEQLLLTPDEYLEKIKVVTNELKKLLEKHPDDEAEKILEQAEDFIESREQA